MKRLSSDHMSFLTSHSRRYSVGLAPYVLNQIVGDERFNQIIRTSIADFFERPASFSDFQGVAESVSKRDLSRFFKEWIFGAESSDLLVGDASIQEIVERYREAAAKN